jgi:3-keto-L-gulonate-6-phosphate decarboxylase/nucleoside phosphorylase
MFTIDPTAAERCDVAVIVPKMDERLGLEESWGIDLKHAHGRLDAGKKYWGMRAEDLCLVIVFLDDQGPASARGIAEQVLSRFNPSLVFLVGTAAGREGKTRIGDVVVSSLVVDLTEQRAGKKATTFRAKHYLPSKLLDDAKEFLAKEFDSAEFATGAAARLQRLDPALRRLYDKDAGPRSVHEEVLASGATLYVGGKLNQVWKYDDRYRAVDMESGGFASALEHSGSQWLIVRGISDFGTPGSKKEEFRSLAAAAAADFLKAFLRGGLDETHPDNFRPMPKPRAARDEVDALYRSLRSRWTPEDCLPEKPLASESRRALDSGHWALEREAERVRAIGSEATFAPTLEDYLGSERQLQVALDVSDIDKARSLAGIVAGAGAGFVEVGAPLIQQSGFRAITDVHQAVPDTPIVAEVAPSDWCGSQVEMAAAAGADIVLLLGCRKERSVIEAATAAARLQVPLIIEVPEELATEAWMDCLKRAGVQGVAAIGNVDSGSEGVISLSRVRDLRRLTTLPVAMSGGLTEADFPALDEVPWDILIVGRAIVESDTPAKTTESMARQVRRTRRM